MNGEVTVTFKSISPRRNSSDTEDRSVVNGESYESQAACTVSFGEQLCHTVPVYNGNTMLQ
ncbi:hypothetical protein pdam_00019615 [Pocillopora damicornis]|uniref:Uncharacterized protein n=1 Tax=Pocillopora damicornis TaxID=46731 RepID=A0A3M6TKN0_POCDA|nr:hypothetical protein pdam_00019615 [Pocillopora damicornis]